MFKTDVWVDENLLKYDVIVSARVFWEPTVVAVIDNVESYTVGFVIVDVNDVDVVVDDVNDVDVFDDCDELVVGTKHFVDLSQSHGAVQSSKQFSSGDTDA